MQRPLGVTILAVLDFIGMGALICFGLLAFVGMGLLGAVLSHRMSEMGSMGPAIMAVGGAVIAVICFFFAAIAGVIGYGMLKLKEWARIVTMALAILGIVGGVFGLAAGVLHLHVIVLLMASIRIAVNLIIVWYLNQPHIKTAFAAQQSMAVRA